MTNGPFWARKWHILITLDLKGANGYMKILLVVFREKVNLGQFDLLAL